MRNICFAIIIYLITVEYAFSQEYSYLYALVGDEKLTVPDYLEPIMANWTRDPYVIYGSDGYYYLAGTSVSPDQNFHGQKHCRDYYDGIYMLRLNDIKNWESRGLIWSYNKEATWQKKGKPIPPGTTSVNYDPLNSIYSEVWALALHIIKSQKLWLFIAYQNGGGGSFILLSTSGKPEGRYVNIKGNENGYIFERIDLSILEYDYSDGYFVN